MWWGQYIDDVILFFSSCEKKLLDFHVHVNSINKKLILQFLDLKISKNKHENLRTSIFRKATHQNTDRSCSQWLIKNIPYGQKQRLRQTCDSDHEYLTQSINMQHQFRQRGYNRLTVDALHWRETSYFVSKKKKIENTLKNLVFSHITAERLSK